MTQTSPAALAGVYTCIGMLVAVIATQLGAPLLITTLVGSVVGLAALVRL
jgi:hypothetical protein